MIRVAREAIRLRGPDGRWYELAEQEQFRAAYSELQVALRSSQRMNPPPLSVASYREPCRQWYFAAPGSGFGFSYLDVGQHRMCNGPLVFKIPGGVQPGSWTLAIKPREHEERIQFTLGDRERWVCVGPRSVMSASSQSEATLR